MTKIKLLNPETINQIAAGEVIENPASVVKELVENAIDAGSSKVFIEIENGGQELIRIQDNGHGMNKEDALLSIQRHATSKLRSHEDLSSIATMGFRGEALAAIASISEFTLVTAEKRSEAPIQEGVELVVHGGEVKSFAPTQSFLGTEIRIRSLFYNVPARKKFLKSPSKDSFEVVKCFTQLALAHPEVAFDLVANKKKEQALPAGTLEARIRTLLGGEYAADLLPLHYEKNDFKIEGYIGAHTSSRPNRQGQHIFLNRRPIISLPLSCAVKEGYGTSLDKDRYPIFVLHITLDGDSVDVNVHPQKKEVRFREEEVIKNGVKEAVSSLLFKQNSAPFLFSEPTAPSFLSAPPPFQQTAYTQSFQYEPRSFEEYEKTPELVYKIAEPVAFAAPLFTLPSFHIVGVYLEYIFADMALERGDGLYIIDTRAALSRIAFEDLTMKKETKAASQKLLTPFLLELSLPEATALIELIPALQNIGFEIREFGKAAFLVEAAPATLEIAELREFFKEVVREEDEDPAKVMRGVARLAARRSLSKKNSLTSELAKEIVRRLLACDEPYRCPFGREILAPLTKEDLQKRF